MLRALLMLGTLTIAACGTLRPPFPVEETSVRLVAGEAMDRLCLEYERPRRRCFAFFHRTAEGQGIVYASPEHFEEAAALICRLKLPAATSRYNTMCVEIVGHELRHAAQGFWHR